MKNRNIPTLMFSCLILFVILTVGDAQAAVKSQPPTGKIIGYGIYKVVDQGVRYQDKKSTAGYADRGVQVALISKTESIPLKKGVTFGIQWEAQGLPEGPVKILIKVKHPRTTKPDGRISTSSDEIRSFVSEKGQIKNAGDYYQLSEDWEMLPGEWSISIVYEGKVLCKKVFNVVTR